MGKGESRGAEESGESDESGRKLNKKKPTYTPVSYQAYQLVQLNEVFGSNTEWIWNNFSHVEIEEMLEEKSKQNEHLEELEENEKTNTTKKQREHLDVLRKEALIYDKNYRLLLSLFGETISDYTPKELDEILKREEKRRALRKEAMEKEIERRNNEDEKDVSDENYITEEQLEKEYEDFLLISKADLLREDKNQLED